MTVAYKIAIGTDHAGVELKNALIRALETEGHQMLDMGTDSKESVDYPDFARAVAQAVTAGKVQYGIVICGSGIGISIAANRYPHVRAALCHEPELAMLARQHNDANVLALAARFITEEKALACAHAFLSTAFEGGRHQRRVDKLSSLPPFA